MNGQHGYVFLTESIQAGIAINIFLKIKFIRLDG